MKSRAYHYFHRVLSFFLSVRVRLTLWYLTTIIFILLVLGWSLSTQTHLAADAADNQVETQLYQDAQPMTATYKQALLSGHPPSSQPVELSSREVLLLLRPDGTVLDTRGPLTDSMIQQLARTDSSQAAFNLTFPQTQTHTHWWWSPTNEYRFLTSPILKWEYPHCSPHTWLAAR
jgi:hypothetical protein